MRVLVSAVVLFVAMTIGRIVAVTVALEIGAELAAVAVSLDQLLGAAVALVGVYGALTFSVDIDLMPNRTRS